MKQVCAFLMLQVMSIMAVPAQLKSDAGSNAFRMVGNLENWKSTIPATEVAQHYTHINYFVMSTGSVEANTCSPTCTLTSDMPQLTDTVKFFQGLGTLNRTCDILSLFCSFRLPWSTIYFNP